MFLNPSEPTNTSPYKNEVSAPNLVPRENGQPRVPLSREENAKFVRETQPEQRRLFPSKER